MKTYTYTLRVGVTGSDGVEAVEVREVQADSYSEALDQVNASIPSEKGRRIIACSYRYNPADDGDDGDIGPDATAEQIIALINRQIKAIMVSQNKLVPYSDAWYVSRSKKLALSHILDRCTAHKLIGRSIEKKGD